MASWRDLIGTVNTVFRIGLNRASLSAAGLTAPRVFTLPDLAGTFALTSQIMVQPPAAVLTNNAVATTETIVARWALPANYFTAGMFFDLLALGQVSGLATLIFQVRIGTAGTTADALAGTFATSAAGVANAHTSCRINVAILTATTATAAGQVQLANATLGPTAVLFAANTIAPASALFVSLTLVQSVAQTYTSRAAMMRRRI